MTDKIKPRWVDGEPPHPDVREGPHINPGWHGEDPFCAPGQCSFAEPGISEQFGKYKRCTKKGYGYGVMVVYGGPCIPAFRQQRDEAESRVKELEAELRGDVDSLICKCGYKDCDAVIAEHDVEDCNWTDTYRIEQLRAIILKRHYDESPSETQVKELEARLESTRVRLASETQRRRELGDMLERVREIADDTRAALARHGASQAEWQKYKDRLAATEEDDE